MADYPRFFRPPPSLFGANPVPPRWNPHYPPPPPRPQHGSRNPPFQAQFQYYPPSINQPFSYPMHGQPVVAEPAPVDDLFIQQWINSRFSSTASAKLHENGFQISDMWCYCRKWAESIKECENLLELLQKSDDPAEWKDIAFRLTNIQSELVKVESVVRQHSDDIVQKLRRRRKKRIWQKNKKQRASACAQAKSHEIEEKHKLIDAWREKVFQKDADLQREKDMKKEADSTLCEINKKVNETKQLIESLKVVRKLRTARMHNQKQKGADAFPPNDEEFEKRIGELDALLETHRIHYSKEKKVLEVILQNEQEQSYIVIKQNREEQKRIKQQREEVAARNVLFGSEDISPENPLYSHWEYFTQAERSLEALVEIRQSWDRYLAAEPMADSSAIPVGWVEPAPPASSEWKVALIAE